MKAINFFFAILSLTTFSCTKQNCDSALSAMLEGSWKMVAVTDNNTGSLTTKPPSVQGDVDITFSAISDSTGTFYGHTPANDISQSDYLTGANHLLTIPFLNMTKVGQTSWGKEFVDNIRNSQEYAIESTNKLVIKTTNITLTFQRQ